MVNFASLEMQSLHQLWLPVSTFALVTSASPGPVNIIAVSSGLRFGVRNTLPQVLGATDRKFKSMRPSIAPWKNG